MKPKLLRLNLGPSQSFSVRQDFIPHMNNQWHYHHEVELIHFKEGHGTQFIGDNIHHFKSGDIVLIGSQLPHYWRFDDSYFNAPKQNRPDVRVAHFDELFWGENFLNLPENFQLKQLLEQARLGLQITGDAQKQIAMLMEDMLSAAYGPRRITLLIEALHIISTCCYQPISSAGFKTAMPDTEKDRINAIFDYSFINFKTKISLDEISDIAGISPNSFCRFFKLRTGKTYSRFLLEIRIGHACKLLIESRMSVKQLCYESGFNNFASFHKYFKQLTGLSPLHYQKKFIQ